MDEKIDPKPDSPPHWGLWGTVILGLLLLGFFILLNLFVLGTYTFFIIRLRFGGIPPSWEIVRIIHGLRYDGFVISLCGIISSLVCGALLIAIIKLKKGASIREYLGLVKFNWRQALRWGGLLIAIILVADLGYFLLGFPIVHEFELAQYKSARYPLLYFIAVLIAAPVWEECFFRGFLLRGLSSSFLRPVGAVAITSALWAGGHFRYELHDMIMVFIIGCLLGTARVKTGSVSLPIAMHFLNNLEALTETIIYLKMNPS